MTKMEIRNIVLFVFVTCLRTALCGEHPDGISQVSRAQDAAGNYHFSYSVANKEGDQFRTEGADSSGRVVGSYGLTHQDGTRRVVDYVADHNGFRAEVRSNEPGVVAPAPSATLAVAATGDDDDGSVPSFGKRLKTDGSSVLDDTVLESRQRNFGDYRPMSPVAYYPSDGRLSPVQRPADVSDARLSPVQRPVDVSRSARVLPDSDSKPIDVYFPPIDPHSAVRRPNGFGSRDASSDRDYYSTSTSRKPYIPPYGGFDDEPLPEARHPAVSMTTIHGGLGSRRHLPPTAPTPSYGSRRFPSDGYGYPMFPPVSSGFPPIPSGPQRVPDGIRAQFPQSSGPQRVPDSVRTQFPQSSGPFGPPVGPQRGSTPNFVLRAVPIPNGIQAVRVDPNSGRVYERLVYPVYLDHDGHPSYDRNILLHNDDGPDDVEDGTSGYFDIPFPSRAAAYRGPRDRPFDDDRVDVDDPRSINASSVIESNYLSRPTASDLAWVRRQLALLEDGLDPERTGMSSYRDSDPSRFASQLRMRHDPGLYDYRGGEEGFPRNTRQDGLSPEESKSNDGLEESASETKTVQENKSEIEKEGN